MLDMRKPYVINIKDREKKLNFDNGEGLPSIAIKARVGRWEEEKGLHLFFYDIGCERGHVIQGKIAKDMKNGIVFDAKNPKWRFTLTELTYDEFNERIRPTLDEHLAQYLNDLDDVYVWYRKLANMT
jgi:hypothetical protein